MTGPSYCVARIGMQRPAWAPRRGVLCGITACDTIEVQINGRAITLTLCRTHLRKFRDSPDPDALAARWISAE